MSTAHAARTETSAGYARGLARACGGALLFALPLLMTMEMWSLGFEMARSRAIVFLLLSLPLVVGLSRFAGFRATATWRDNIMDGLSALLVGFLISGSLLLLFGVIAPGQPADEVVGKVALQAVPAAFGAVLARKQLAGAEDEDGTPAEESWPAEMFLMVAGALFVALNVAPTEEMQLIAYMMTPWHSLVLVAVSIGLLHALVYWLGFAGQHEHDQPLLAFIRFTVPGYALVLLVALYVQWTFGHLDGHGLGETLMITVVIAFPGAVGAGAARLLV